MKDDQKKNQVDAEDTPIDPMELGPEELEAVAGGAKKGNVLCPGDCQSLQVVTKEFSNLVVVP